MRRDQRPDPDRLLDLAREEERQRTHGKLRIYLGYAAGVGKTYAMLEAARQERAAGTDVVIGLVETHGRKETDALLPGLERIPLREVEYRGIKLQEMDLEAILRRKPTLVLVDELAHTNAPGSRHPKRHQDVDELLAAGIDVYTTLNVQHLESMKETVAQISGVLVGETVPDSVFDRADEIKVVDISPQELLQRFKAGKVYVPEQAERAMRTFFQVGNLIALRQIALRRVAERLDEQMRDYMESRAIPGPWPARERLLVVIDPRDGLGERVVRAGRRLADELFAEWEAIVVGEGAEGRASPEARAPAADATRLAETLGAAVHPTALPAEGGAVIAHARAHNITRVIVGWRIGPRWREVLLPHLATQVIRESGPIDVIVITDEGAAAPPRALRARGTPDYRGYVLAVLAVTAAGVLGEYIRAGWLSAGIEFNPVGLAMFFVIAVAFVATARGLGPALLTATLSVLLYGYLFVPPRFSFAIEDPQYYVMFAVMYVTGVIISALIARTRRRAERAERQSARVGTLYALSRDLASAPTLEAILAAVIGHIQSSYDASAAILMPEPGGMRVAAASHGLAIGRDDMAVADWVVRNGRPGGLGTDTLPGARMTHLPMKGGRHVIGVVSLMPKPGVGPRTLAEDRVLEGLVSLTALAIERVRAEAAPPPPAD